MSDPLLDSGETIPLTGRAGRRSSQFPVGYATCMNRKELPILEKAMATPMSDLSTPTAGKTAKMICNYQ